MIVFLQVSACRAAPVNESEFAEVSTDRVTLVQPDCVFIVAEFASNMLKRVIQFENQYRFSLVTMFCFPERIRKMKELFTIKLVNNCTIYKKLWLNYFI